MGIYSRALNHIDMTRVKELREEKIKRKKDAKEFIEQIRDELRNLNSPEFSNWRCNIDEGMTSSGLFKTTLPATGDADLIVTSLQSTSFNNSDQVSFDSGTNSGLTGGFSNDSGIANLPGTPNFNTTIDTHSMDLSAVDTVNITAIAGDDFNGGITPSSDLLIYFSDQENLSDTYTVISKTTSSFTNVNIAIPPEWRRPGVSVSIFSNTGSSGEQGLALSSFTIQINGLNHATIGTIPFGVGGSTGVNNTINSYLKQSATTANYKLLGQSLWGNIQNAKNGFSLGNNPNYGQPGETQFINLNNWDPAPVSGNRNENGSAPDANGNDAPGVTDDDYIYIGKYIYDTFKGYSVYGVSNISFKRRVPMTVFVALDSPEATAFIRTDPTMKGLSAEERKKKLMDMLDAGDEYLLKYLGLIGSKARPSDTTMPDSWEDAADSLKDITPQQRSEAEKIINNLSKYGDIASVDAMVGGVENTAAVIGAIVTALGIGVDAATDLYNSITNTGRSDAGYGADTTNPTPPKDLTPDQQAEVDAANTELKDARKALYDLPADATDAQRDMAQERYDRADKNRQRLRKKHREENKNRKESYKLQGRFLSEKKKLKSVKDVPIKKIPGYYDGKPAPLGFPMQEPPKMINGYHPDLVTSKGQKKQSNRYNRLDPISAKAMPKTGNPHIDKKVKAAAKKLKESMTTSSLMSTTLTATGDVDLVNVDVSNADTWIGTGNNGGTVSATGLSFDQRPSQGDSAVNWSFANATSALDATQVNNLKVTVTTGTGVDAPKSGNPLKVEWFNGADFGFLGTFSAGGGTQVFELPKEANVKDLKIFYSVSSDGTNPYSTYSNEYLVGKDVFGGTMNSTDSSGAMSILRLGASASEANKILFGRVWWNDAIVGNGNPRGYQIPSNPEGDGFNDSDSLALYNEIISLYASFATRGSNLYTITTTNFQRRTPMNVFVSLDSPEATAFIRTDPSMQGLSAEDRRKKLIAMLDAGDEYLLKYLGLIGSTARPSDVTMPASWEQAGGYGAGGPNPYGTRGAEPAYKHSSPMRIRVDGKMKNINADDPGQWPSIVQKAGYEPQGEVLSEKKKLKSPKDIASKIPGYYDGKPAPLGFPMDPPPKTINGYHPDLVDGKKIANRFNRLDPASAKAMPPTGNPHIDKKVKAAAKKSK